MKIRMRLRDTLELLGLDNNNEAPSKGHTQHARLIVPHAGGIIRALRRGDWKIINTRGDPRLEHEYENEHEPSSR